MKHEGVPTCEMLVKFLERVNKGEQLDQGEKERLHTHLLSCSDCRKNLSEEGKRILCL